MQEPHADTSRPSSFGARPSTRATPSTPSPRALCRQLLAASALALACFAACDGPVVIVRAIPGPLHGWVYADNRASGYVDEDGFNQLVWERSAEERALIAERVSLVWRAPERSHGAVRFRSPAVADKATIRNDRIAADLAFERPHFTYSWYRTSGGVAAPALKLFIVSPDEPRLSDPLSVTRGYDAFNYELVYEPYLQRPTADHAWTTEVIDPTKGVFWLVSMTPGGGVLANYVRRDLLTLAEWVELFAAYDVDAPRLVGAMLGVGSGNPNQDSYVEDLGFSADGLDWTTWQFRGSPAPRRAR